MSKYWTVQHKEILKIIEREGIYKPDIYKSDFIKTDPKLKNLYNFVRESFNDVNGTNVNGLIFSFAFSEGMMIYHFESYSEFQQHIRENKEAILSLWNHYNPDDYVIMELEYDNTFNPLFIDINDFQALMPPIMILPPYFKEDLNNIIENLRVGRATASIFPSHLIQAHLPYIERENIINLYPYFALED